MLISDTFYLKYETSSGKCQYPFGMLMRERSKSYQDYRFGFNGMEQDDEVSGSGNSLDFGARIYNSRLGRWLCIDPLVKPFHSNYEYAFSSPLLVIDADGNDEVIYDPADNSVRIINTNGPLRYYEIKYAQTSSNGLASVSIGSRERVDWRTSSTFSALLNSSDEMAEFLYRSAYSNKEGADLFLIRMEHNRSETGKGVAMIGVVLVGTGATPILILEAPWLAIGKEIAEGVVEEITALPYVPLFPDVTDVADPVINKGIRVFFQRLFANREKRKVLKKQASRKTFDLADPSNIRGANPENIKAYLKASGWTIKGGKKSKPGFRAVNPEDPGDVIHVMQSNKHTLKKGTHIDLVKTG